MTATFASLNSSSVSVPSCFSAASSFSSADIDVCWFRFGEPSAASFSRFRFLPSGLILGNPLTLSPYPCIFLGMDMRGDKGDKGDKEIKGDKDDQGERIGATKFAKA